MTNDEPEIGTDSARLQELLAGARSRCERAQKEREEYRSALHMVTEQLAASQARVAELEAEQKQGIDDYLALRDHADERHVACRKAERQRDDAREEARQAQARVAEEQAAYASAEQRAESYREDARQALGDRDKSDSIAADARKRLAASEAACESLRAALCSARSTFDAVCCGVAEMRVSIGLGKVDEADDDGYAIGTSCSLAIDHIDKAIAASSCKHKRILGGYPNATCMQCGEPYDPNAPALAATPPAPAPRDAPQTASDMGRQVARDVLRKARAKLPSDVVWAIDVLLDAPAPTIAAQPPDYYPGCAGDCTPTYVRSLREAAAQPQGTEPPPRAVSEPPECLCGKCIGCQARRIDAQREQLWTEAGFPGSFATEPPATAAPQPCPQHGTEDQCRLDREARADMVKPTVTRKLVPQPTTGDPRAAIAEAMESRAEKLRADVIAATGEPLVGFDRGYTEALETAAADIRSWPLPPDPSKERALSLLRGLDARRVWTFERVGQTISEAIAELEGAK